MAVNLIVQGDDQLIPNANALIDIDFADYYHGNRNNTDWLTLSEDAKKAAIIHGTDYASSEFDFRGTKRWSETEGQVVAFPRSDLNDEHGRPITGVPLGVKRAICELAFFSTKQHLYGHTSTSVNKNVKIKEQKIKIGPIEETIKYEEGSGGGVVASPIYPQIVNWLRPYTKAIWGNKVLRG